MAQAARRVGQTIAGKYALLSVLGAGGMGAVYKAQHLFTAELVAVKLLFPDVASNPEAVARFIKEARAPAMIGHPGIVKVHDAAIDPATHEVYLAMELLSGEDLAGAVDCGGVDLSTLITIVLQLLDVLATSHARGFVHRDIKPENVFVTRAADGSPVVKLLDFGVARHVDPASPAITATGMVLGTPWYMTPEQAKGIPVDARADLWSVGALLFHALAGRPPFDGDNYNMVMVALVTSAAPPLATLRPDLSPSLLAVVDRALRPSLADRWQSAGEMASAIVDAARELAGTPVPITTTLRKRRSKLGWSAAPERTRADRRLRGPLVVATAALVLAAIVLPGRLRRPPMPAVAARAAAGFVVAPAAVPVAATPVDAGATPQPAVPIGPRGVTPHHAAPIGPSVAVRSRAVRSHRSTATRPPVEAAAPRSAPTPWRVTTPAPAPAAAAGAPAEGRRPSDLVPW